MAIESTHDFLFDGNSKVCSISFLDIRKSNKMPKFDLKMKVSEKNGSCVIRNNWRFFFSKFYLSGKIPLRKR